MSAVSVIRLGEALIATVPQDLSDNEALTFREMLAGGLEASSAELVLLDISALEIVDSFIGRLLSDIAQVSRLLGAETVIVGMQPPVAMTLVELGLDLKGVRTALTPERALAVVRQASRWQGRNDQRR